MSQKTVYGIVNFCFYAPPDGARTYYLTRKARDRALADLRDLAIERGLAASAALSGIRPVKRVLRDTTPGAEALIESASENERDLAALATGGDNGE